VSAGEALREEAVQVRLESLCLTPHELARLRGYLSPEELKRGNRLLDQERRDAFFAGRGLLREALAGYLGEEPGRIVLTEREFGKPQLSRRLERATVCFNISHTGRYLIMVFAAAREVGVDLEEIRQDLPFRAMAERYFSAREREELFSLPPSDQLAAFYRCWTRKEAYLKATGSGFSQPSTVFDVSLLPQDSPALLSHRGSPEETERWSIKDLAVPEGYCAALVIQN